MSSPSKPCRFGASCHNKACTFDHPGAAAAVVDCRFGVKCTNKACKFAHPAKPKAFCRYGLKCHGMKDGTCEFAHKFVPRRPTSQATIEKAYASVNDGLVNEKIKAAAFLHRELARKIAMLKRLQAEAQELDVFLKAHPQLSVAGQELNDKFNRNPEEEDEEDSDE